MELSTFEHRSTRWTPSLRAVATPDVETGLEVVFVPEEGGPKYAWPLAPRTLEAVVEGGIALDRHRLRKMLRRAMDAGRRPSNEPGTPEDAGVLARKVRKLLE